MAASQGYTLCSHLPCPPWKSTNDGEESWAQICLKLFHSKGYRDYSGERSYCVLEQIWSTWYGCLYKIWVPVLCIFYTCCAGLGWLIFLQISDLHLLKNWVPYVSVCWWCWDKNISNHHWKLSGNEFQVKISRNKWKGKVLKFLEAFNDCMIHTETTKE